MSGYIGTKSVTLSTTAATVGGSSTVGAGLTVDNDGATVLTVDRATSDGTIIDVQKGGTSVGSIGTQGGDLWVGTGNTGAYFWDGSNTIAPWNTSTNTTRDAGIDLGTSSVRWKDLYLSGGVYLGGTGAANKLDDYEEGTWTPSFLAGFSGTVTYGIQNGLYVKIGCLVYCDFYIFFSGTGNSAQIQVQGLPFNSTNGHSGYARGGGTSSYQNINNSTAQFYGTNNNSIFSLYENGNAGLSSSVSLSNKYLIGTYVYKTDA